MTVAGAAVEPQAPGRGTGDRAAPIARIGVPLMPALLVAYLAFRSGGYTAEAYGSAAVILALALGGTLLASRSWFGAGFSSALIVAAGALSLLVAWTWLSSRWSSAPASAVFETPRA